MLSWGEEGWYRKLNILVHLTLIIIPYENLGFTHDKLRCENSFKNILKINLVSIKKSKIKTPLNSKFPQVI